MTQLKRLAGSGKVRHRSEWAGGASCLGACRYGVQDAEELGKPLPSVS